MNEVEKMIKKQKDWKEFEKCLKPIFENCQNCKEYGICKFHEDWYYKVKETFDKFKKTKEKTKRLPPKRRRIKR